jgi:hypothetical protein
MLLLSWAAKSVSFSRQSARRSGLPMKNNSADAKRFKDFVRKYDMCLEHVHTSGHATVDKLKEFAAALNTTARIKLKKMI